MSDSAIISSGWDGGAKCGARLADGQGVIPLDEG
jgi:hypothetical protein